MITNEKRQEIINRIVEYSHQPFTGEEIVLALGFDYEEWECSTEDSKYWNKLKELIEPSETDKQFIPEKFKWPRFENGSLIQIGDTFVGKDGKYYNVDSISFMGRFYSLHDFCDRKPQFNGRYTDLVQQPDSWEKYEEKLANLLNDGEIAHNLVCRAKKIARSNNANE